MFFFLKTQTNITTNYKGSIMKIAFLHESMPERSGWTYGHELGRQYLEEVMKGQVQTVAFDNINSEELGLELALTGVRAVCTVNFATGFDDYYVLHRDVDLSTLRLQTEEVSDVRWATRSQVMAMVRRGEFITYPESFLSYLFDTAGSQDFPTKSC